MCKCTFCNHQALLLERYLFAKSKRACLSSLVNIGFSRILLNLIPLDCKALRTTRSHARHFARFMSMAKLISCFANAFFCMSFNVRTK